MGYMRHNAIVVTSWNSEAIEAAACRARTLGLTVLGPSAALMNGYKSMMVCPDGSKEGWENSDQGEKQRAELRDWLRERSNLEWVEIAYGNSDCTAEVEATAWMPKG